MATIYNNTLRITGDSQKIALLPKWEKIGFYDTKNLKEHNYLLAPILPVSKPENRLEIWGIESDCLLESVDRWNKEDATATIKLQFDSQENSPLIGIRNLAKIYPDLSFDLQYNQQGKPKASVKINQDWGSNIKVSRTQITRQCAADFLSTVIPVKWDKWNTEKQENFIAKNLWEPLEYLDPSTISELIWGTSNNIAKLLINSGVSIIDDEK